MVRLRLEGIEKVFAAVRPAVQALRGVSLDIPSGGTLALVGPSGCGKTTLLRVVAGLEKPGAGRVTFDERNVTQLASARRGAGVVFAEDALFPHLSAYDNIAYGPRTAAQAAPEVERAVRAAARTMRIEALLARRAKDLSGGERQRVALARALASGPAVLLLDEPLSRLDAPLRAELRLELGRILRARTVTSLLVTHDQSEALVLGDRVAVMHEGRIVQVGSPREVYERPASVFVARFVGAPAMSLLPAQALGISPSSGMVTLGFRAEDVRLAAGGDVPGIVSVVEDFGSDAYVYVDVSFGSLVARAAGRPPAAGERVTLALDMSRAHAFDASGARVREFARA